MIFDYGKIIKNNTFRDSVELFDTYSSFYNVKFDFSYNEFENFINNLYMLYEDHKEIYKYRSDMQQFLLYAIDNKTKCSKKIITLEDILDSIYEIKTNKDDNNIIDKCYIK